MDASFLLGIWVFNNVEFGSGAKVRNFREGNEVVDLLAVKLEVEASVLECGGKVNDRLSNLMNLFLRRNLNILCELEVLEGLGLSQ
jgi:hypothetical protein